jgi:hypothetical protein
VFLISFFAQAMGRVYRQGQTKPTTMYRLFTAGTVEEVIYQRQSQKGGLAAMTVDGNAVSSGSGGRFTKEEIADCFTLKEDCPCDTKRKVGFAWPAYEGPDSLFGLGCTDEPLLQIAESMSETLGHIHIVDSAGTASSGGDDDGESYPSNESADFQRNEDDENSTSEEEFDIDGDDDE